MPYSTEQLEIKRLQRKLNARTREVKQWQERFEELSAQYAELAPADEVEVSTMVFGPDMTFTIKANKIPRLLGTQLDLPIMEIGEGEYVIFITQEQYQELEDAIQKESPA